MLALKNNVNKFKLRNGKKSVRKSDVTKLIRREWYSLIIDKCRIENLRKIVRKLPKNGEKVNNF